ncbi:HIT family protein [Pyrobaculum neutrophilum]|uniref:Histidine triad (HIT) protein n=1 Tax=Pyrobaculum neutrophilum (strain DSM 2338 / JCM 9278 / NBRC 100436 / V24Sta) TaxID=444157 RepID=B1YDG8_PYRNV|nr:HIT domain-containing protein [Pyrobaculum neutrophilum]ACB39831.1 histidine triad (HIT) protein [Pyrobaculum neutrophilum V24Sta]
MDFNVVYAPWRLRYIQNVGKGECFLCKAAGERERDDENLVPARGKHVFAILNKFPYTWGHVMVSPYRHVSQFEELTAEEWAEMVDMARRLMEALKKTVGAGRFIVGLNIGRAAGAGLEGHLHLHIIPDREVEPGVDLPQALVKLTRELREAL